MSKLRWVAIGLLVLVASSALSRDVRYNFDKNADFTKFKTYKWVPIKDAAPVDDITDKQIKAALDTELATKGLTKVDGDTAELFVGYQVGVGTEKHLLLTVRTGDTEAAGTEAAGRVLPEAV